MEKPHLPSAFSQHLCWEFEGVSGRKISQFGRSVWPSASHLGLQSVSKVRLGLRMGGRGETATEAQRKISHVRVLHRLP